MEELIGRGTHGWTVPSTVQGESWRVTSPDNSVVPWWNYIRPKPYPNVGMDKGGAAWQLGQAGKSRKGRASLHWIKKMPKHVRTPIGWFELKHQLFPCLHIHMLAYPYVSKTLSVWTYIYCNLNINKD